MKHLKKAAVLMLALIMIFSAAGCKKGQKTSSKQSSSSKTSQTTKKEEVKLVDGKFSLPYTNVATFNPFAPASQLNMDIWPLMYDSLCSPDENYKAQMNLADNVKNSGNTVTVKIKSGIKFTDGTTLTANDVRYSLNLVLTNTSSPFYSKLSNVNSISQNGSSVVFNLKTPDPLFANMLTIPIIKAGSETKGNAIGTGRFVYSRDGTNAKLTLNKNWYGKQTPIISSINLFNIPYKDAIMSSLSIANVNCVYSDNGTGLLGSATDVTSDDVNINQLVYVGLNTGKERFKKDEFRKALSYSIDRESIVTQNYSNHALGTITPFNPKWSDLKAPSDDELKADYTKSGTAMQAAGGAGTKTTFTLLVNQENATRHSIANYVASCFTKAGITVNVKALPYSEYTAAIQGGNYDMYIGEVKLQNNMDLSPFFVSGGSAAYNMLSDSKAYAAFNNWKQGKGDISAAATAFSDEMPFIPLCFRLGTVSHSTSLSGLSPLSDNIFNNFDKWGYIENK